jgi:excisionase family DNA binding protein
LRRSDIGRTVEDERHENAAESAGKRPGTGSNIDIDPARNHLQGIHFGLSPPSQALVSDAVLPSRRVGCIELTHIRLRNPEGGESMNKLLYRPKEAAQLLGIGRDKLYDLMRSGRLHSVKDGRARFITASALTEYVAMLEAEAHKAA